jgi:hypothetical protein
MTKRKIAFALVLAEINKRQGAGEKKGTNLLWVKALLLLFFLG